MKIRRSRSDLIFDILNLGVCIVIFLLVLYPLVYVVSASISSPLAVLQGRMVLWPIEPRISAYTDVFKHQDLMMGYRNSLILVIFGTTTNITLTFFGAYILSRKDLFGRTFLTMLFALTMFFSGGMIPTYLVVKKVGLLNSMWAMILPGAISMYNMVVMRTYFQTAIPDSLIESAEADGASQLYIMFRIILPLSHSIIAVICLFYGVAHWNQYFQALLYLTSRVKYPLQLFLREILLLSQVQELVDTQGFADQVLQGEAIKYALIIVASVPVMVVYPFIQRHFVKGVMLGAIKG
ncbi:MAG: carbohydrate ABC transporter permease [Spirochaetaceae bacterium]|jgi:putative aldouronate transport system permease protein|nr:carbohydrate ABC transporter permease [Spirochaetaceae bacterium]